MLIASLVNKKAYWEITKFDLVCGGLSILALILWGITRTGNIAIALSIMADGLAAVPTVIKAYRRPDTENSSFIFGAISAAITLLTIQNWTFAQYGFPIYILLICTLLFTLIRFPNFRPAKVAS